MALFNAYSNLSKKKGPYMPPSKMPAYPNSSNPYTKPVPVGYPAKQQMGSSQPTLIKSQPSQPTKPTVYGPAKPVQLSAFDKARQLAQQQLKSNPNQEIRYGASPAQNGQSQYSVQAQGTNPQQQASVDAARKAAENIPSAPTPAPTPAPNMQTYYDDAKARQDKVAADKYASDVAYNNSAYNNLETGIKGRLSNAEGYLKDYETGTQADIDAERVSADRAKVAKEQEYGSDQRTMMQQRRQQKGELEKQYAALGTIDSYGAGSFTGANTNLETDFGRQSNKNLMKKQSAIDDIDANFSKYERTVKQAIQAERSKFNDKVLEINTTLAGNAIEKKRAIDTAYNTLKATEADLQNTWEGLKMQLEQDKYTASKALYDGKQSDALLNSDMEQLKKDAAGAFSGKQATMNDFFYISAFAKKHGIANPSDVISFIKQQQAGQAGSGAYGKLAAKDANIANTGIKEVQNIRDFYAKNPGINQNINPLDQTKRQYDSSILNTTDLIGRLRSGGAINTGEEQRFMKLLPTYWDDSTTVNNKLNRLNEEFSSLLNRQAIPGGNGGNELADMMEQYLASN